MIGRRKELELLKNSLESDRSRLIVVYGRRRVGKTFLIREAFDYRFTFTHTGLEDGTYEEQLGAFWRSVCGQGGGDYERPHNWFEAFDILKQLIQRSKDERKTLFIDELPWLDTKNSGFIKAFADFWNGWATARKDIVLVVCGSAAAWMLKKVLNSRGGLFNRANRIIRLAPFTLKECEEYLESEGVVMDRKDIVSAYMIFGGAPYYWSLLDKSESLVQNIDRLFFSPGAELAGEFKKLYRSVFENPEPYMAIVTTLGTRKVGMTRDQLIENTPGIESCGALTEWLDNLEASGFIRKYAETGNVKRGTVYQLIDNFTLFYFRFMEDKGNASSDYWSVFSGTQEASVWRGLAFERVALQHVDQIKKRLGISGVITRQYAWRCRAAGAEDGAQIDLVIERNDAITNLCEMKCTDEPFEISDAYDQRLRGRRERFLSETKTADAVHLTFISASGLKANANAFDIQSVVTLDDLFA